MAAGRSVADRGVTAAGSDELQGESGKGFGQHDGFTAESQPYFVVVVFNVVQSEATDGRRPLGVEQKQQTGDTVFGFDRWVVQQSTGLLPACFGVDDPCWSAPSDCGIVSRVSFCFLALRTKCPASSRCWRCRR